MRAYWYSYEPACGVVRSLDEDSAEQGSNGADEGAYAQGELDPSHNPDDNLDFWVHRLRSIVAVRKHDIAVRVPVEVDEWAFGLLLGRRRRHATRDGDGLWVERVALHRRIVEERLPLLTHGDDTQEGKGVHASERSTARNEREGRLTWLWNAGERCGAGDGLMMGRYVYRRRHGNGGINR
jgi:hypothetical protein